MKRIVNFLFLFLAQLSMLLIIGCSDDDNIDTNNGGKASITINGEPYFSSEVGDFVFGEFMGSNFIDDLTSDGCYYAYANFYPSENLELEKYSIELYFKPIDFTTARQGTILIKCEENLQKWSASIIGQIYLRDFKTVVSGNVSFDSYDPEKKLVKLNINNLTFVNDSGTQIVFDGTAYFNDKL